jgi:hypothetical protein
VEGNRKRKTHEFTRMRRTNGTMAKWQNGKKWQKIKWQKWEKWQKW